MDRRGFISVVGALAATAGASVGVSSVGQAREAASAKARAAGLAQSAGMPASAAETLATPDTRFVDVAFIPEHAIEAARTEMARMAGQKVASYSGGPRYAIRLAGLRRARQDPALQSVDVVARFAIDEPPNFVSFLAWSHVEGTPPRTSSPIDFTALAPDRAALEVSYVLSPGIAGPSARSGQLYLPIGGTGLGPGIYVMTTPSASTGVTPDIQNFSYSGNSRSPIIVRHGTPLDFDHFVFDVRTYRG